MNQYRGSRVLRCAAREISAAALLFLTLIKAKSFIIGGLSTSAYNCYRLHTRYALDRPPFDRCGRRKNRFTFNVSASVLILRQSRRELLVAGCDSPSQCGMACPSADSRMRHPRAASSRSASSAAEPAQRKGHPLTFDHAVVEPGRGISQRKDSLTVRAAHRPAARP